MIKVLIPVRSGSVRVKNKNIKPFAGSNLLTLKIEQMKRIKGIDGVIVNSNSDEMLELAASLGAEAVKRDEYFASSTVCMNEVYKNMAENSDCDTIIFADATNPLIKDETIEHCIKAYFENLEKYDSLTTVNEIKQFMWQDGKPINYDAANKPKSQDLPDIVALNHAISIIPRKLMIEKMDIIGYKPNLFKIDSVEATDIDNEIDFEFAEFMYSKYRMVN
ncbi:MAG: acylneuraminate cytidylyltransferase family protein [Candidatus Gastranaerophilales bacterium]|nr:acylneuraminate cytidylyltransferase family protein [Candidatus Gastranaerophilales bacterium]